MEKDSRRVGVHQPIVPCDLAFIQQTYERLLQRRNRKDRSMEVRDLLFRDIGDTPERRKDTLAMIQLSGRKIGSSSSGEIVYYVLDGMVYATLPAVPLLMRIDYFEFCDLLRSKSPEECVRLDFLPESNFHLGKRNAEPMAGEGSKPMAWPPGASEPGQGRQVGTALGDPPQGAAAAAAEQMFELMYASGGHGGPIAGMEEATETAKNVCVGRKDTVYIVPRDHRALHPRNAVRRVKQHPMDDGMVVVEDV